MTGFRMAFVVGSTKSIKLYSTIKGHTDSGQFIPIQKAAAFALDNYKELIEENIKNSRIFFITLLNLFYKHSYWKFL